MCAVVVVAGTASMLRKRRRSSLHNLKGLGLGVDDTDDAIALLWRRCEMPTALQLDFLLKFVRSHLQGGVGVVFLLSSASCPCPRFVSMFLFHAITPRACRSAPLAVAVAAVTRALDATGVGPVV